MPDTNETDPLRPLREIQLAEMQDEVRRTANRGERQRVTEQEESPPRKLYDLVFGIWERKLHQTPMPYGSELEREARELAREIVDELWRYGLRPTRTILDRRTFD